MEVMDTEIQLTDEDINKICPHSLNDFVVKWAEDNLNKMADPQPSINLFIEPKTEAEASATAGNPPLPNCQKRFASDDEDDMSDIQIIGIKTVEATEPSTSSTNVVGGDNEAAEQLEDENEIQLAMQGIGGILELRNICKVLRIRSGMQHVDALCTIMQRYIRNSLVGKLEPLNERAVYTTPTVPTVIKQEITLSDVEDVFDV